MQLPAGPKAPFRLAKNISAAAFRHPTDMPHRTHLKLASETEAQGRTAELFAEIQQTLGVPYAGLVFRAYGVYPAFLELFWQSVRPGIADAQFFACAERLRASAYTRAYSYFPVPDFCAHALKLRLSNSARDELRSTVELLSYYNGLQLLLVAVVFQAFDSPVGRAPRSPKPASHPAFPFRPVLIDEGTAAPSVARIFDEIKRTFGAPIVNADFRAFARFPDFLENYWSVLQRVLELPLYAESQFGVQDTALAVAREFPAEVRLGKDRLESAGIGDDDIAAVLRATSLFLKLFSSSLLNLAIARIGFEGGNEKKPVTGPPARRVRAA